MDENQLENEKKIAEGASVSSDAFSDVIAAPTRPDTLQQLAVMLESVARDLRCSARMGQTEDMDDLRLVHAAKKTYSRRRQRESIFGDSSLADGPAWDMLLDLYVCAQEGHAVPVTSACIGASCPQTTALRWLNALESYGLVTRFDDDRDLRRTFVELTPLGCEKVAQALRL
jgi:hypothetical protein